MIFVNGLAVTGMVILIGYAGQISLGHAGFAGIGGYACAPRAGSPRPPPQPRRHPRRRHPGRARVASSAARSFASRGYYLAVATLGLGILVSMVLANEAWLTGALHGIEVPDLGLNDILDAMGLDRTNSRSGTSSPASPVIGAWIASPATARPAAHRALHGSEIAARTVGIDVARLKLQAFVISAIYASLAGPFSRCRTSSSPRTSPASCTRSRWSPWPSSAGSASVLGAFVAAILTTPPQVLTVFQEYEQILLGLVMMLCMIFMREGLLRSILRAFRGKDK